jgi:hypothetical protein
LNKIISDKSNTIKNIKQTGLLYILQKPKHINTNIYKIGRTVGADQRLSNYDKDCEVIFVSFCLDYIRTREKFLHRYLHKLCSGSNDYKAVSDEGREYYDMPLEDIQEYVNEFVEKF